MSQTKAKEWSASYPYLHLSKLMRIPYWVVLGLDDEREAVRANALAWLHKNRPGPSQGAFLTHLEHINARQAAVSL